MFLHLHKAKLINCLLVLIDGEEKGISIGNQKKSPDIYDQKTTLSSPLAQFDQA